MGESGKRPLNRNRILVIAICVGFLVFGAGLLVIKKLITDDAGQRRRRIQQVTLLTPPPPPKIKEQPPEPEQPPEEKIPEPEQKPEPTPEQADDAEPPGEELGLDADAGLGGDAFGLKAKKGGQGLIGGKGGSLYSWYTSAISTDLQQLVNEIIQERGGLPEGQWRTVVEVEIDSAGRIRSYSIIGSSGNVKMDEAVQEALRVVDTSEPPPPGMPHVLKLSFSSQG